MKYLMNSLFFLSNILEKVLFYEIFNFPILIILLIFACIYFSFYLDFPAVKYFKSSFKEISNSDVDSEGGLLKSKQSLFTSLASIMGIGCIAGVATATYIGGIGSIFWIVVISFFSMNLSFAENLLAVKYKNVNENEKSIECAPISYIRNLFRDLNWAKFGIVLSCIYAFLYFVGLIGSQIYQVEEAVNLLAEFKFLSNYKILMALLFNLLILFIVYGGITKIANIFDKLLPTVVGLYIFGVSIILICNFTKIPFAIYTIVLESFKLKSITGGIIGAICIGVIRGICCNEAGLGTSTTPYAAMKTDSFIKPAKMGSLNPFFISIMCLFTGLAIVVSGVYGGNYNGVVLIKKAFDSVSPYFSCILTVVISLLTLSVCISSAFNAQNVYTYFFGKTSLFVYYLIQFIMLMNVIFFDLDQVIAMSDTLYLSVAVPNLICIFAGRKIIKEIYMENKEKEN